MKKLLIIITIALCGCTGDAEKQMSASDSLSMQIDSMIAGDSLLMKLKNDTLTKTEKP